jgi:hypothetical protein
MLVKQADIKQISNHYVILGKYHFLSYDAILEASKETNPRPSELSRILTATGISHKQPFTDFSPGKINFSLTPILKKLSRFEEDPELQDVKNKNKGIDFILN